MTGFALSIPGEPVPKARPRVYGRRAITPKRTLDAEQRIRQAFHERYPGSTPNEGNVELSACFYMNKTGRPDLDNLLKLVMDALNGLAYQDDSQVVRFHASKVTPDRMLPGSKPDSMRKRRTGDPLTENGVTYETHTLVIVNEI
jgi:Holliday junction resolvase RusA-like endonuclease